MPGKKPVPPSRAQTAWLPYLVAGSAAVVTGYVFIAPGHPITVDVWPHFGRTEIVAQAIRNGVSPFWSFMYYCGFPHLRFYSPLFYFLTGLVNWVCGGQFLLGARIVLFLLHLLSAWAMFAYLRYRQQESSSAALGALVYLLIPWRTHYVAGIGNYPLSLLYLVLPLSFMTLEQLLQHPTLKKGLLLGLLLALTVLSHVVYGVFTFLFLAVLLLFRPRQSRTVPGDIAVQAVSPYGTVPIFATGGLLRALALALLVCMALSAFFVFPFLLEYRSHVYPSPVLNLPAPDLGVLLGFNKEAHGYSGTYLGLSGVVLLLIAVGRLLLKPGAERRRQRPMLIGLALALFLTFVAPYMVRGSALQNASVSFERFLFYYMFFVALLVPSAYEWLRDRLARWRIKPAFVFLGLVVILAIDCLPGALHTTYFRREQFLGVREQIYRIIQSQPHSRVLDVHDPLDRMDEQARTCGYPPATYLFGGLPTPLGLPYHQFAPRAMLYAYPWVNEIARDLGDSLVRTVGANTLKACALLGISHIIVQPKILGTEEHGGERYQTILVKSGLPWNDQQLSGQSAKPLTFARAPGDLVLASNRLHPMPAEHAVTNRTLDVADDWKAVLDSVQVDFATNRMSFIPVPAGHPAESLPGQPEVKVIAGEQRNDRVRVSVDATTVCFLRLAVSYYPELRVELDNRPVQFQETKDHFVLLRCPAGNHGIQVTAPLSPLRRLLLLFSGLATLLLIAALGLGPRLHRKTAPATR
jgi:hypothetical protein